MPRGVCCQIGVRTNATYSLSEIAVGTGLSVALVSLIFSGRRPATPYAQARLATFFGISNEELLTPGTIRNYIAPVRPLGRVAGEIYLNGAFRKIRFPAGPTMTDVTRTPLSQSRARTS